jgi:hypothetical protein
MRTPPVHRWGPNTSSGEEKLFEDAKSATTAAGKRCGNQPTPVRKARRFVPGVRRASAKRSVKLSGLSQWRLSSRSRCRTATVAFPA